MPFPENDALYEDSPLTKVIECDDGYDLRHGGMGCYLKKKDWPGDAPQVGQTLRIYSDGGCQIRGMFIDGVRAFYRTPEEEREHLRQWVEDQNAEKKRKFEEELKPQLDESFAALPPEFQARITRFREVNADFRWEFEPYEMFVCEQAAALAGCLKTAGAIDDFYRADHSEQKEMFPGLSEEHSGNTFGASCMLAKLYLTSPELVSRMHGALCPLVGCQEYGCYAAYPDQEATEEAHV